MPVGYGDTPPVGSGSPASNAGREAPADREPANELPPAGPHDDPALTNPDSTPGTGALPAPGSAGDVDSTSS